MAANSNDSLQQSPIEPIIDCVCDALVASLLETGQAHYKIDCGILPGDKDEVLVALHLGTKFSFRVSRKAIRACHRLRVTETTKPLQKVAIHLHNALVNCVCTTGHAQFEIESELINREKGISRVRLLLGTTYSITLSRKEIAGSNSLRHSEGAQPYRLGL